MAGILKVSIFILFFSLEAGARTVEDIDYQRLSGFAEHKKSNKDFDKEREKASDQWKEELSEWQARQIVERNKYLKQKAAEVLPEDEPKYRSWLKEKKAEHEEAEQRRLIYIEEARKSAISRKKINLTDEEELDLISDRPRYDYKKRTLYGGRGTFKGQTGSWGKSGGSSGSSSGSGNYGFPPPPSFDESDNYIPPPLDLDEPPPPPPPPPSFGEEGMIPPPPPMGGFEGAGGF